METSDRRRFHGSGTILEFDTFGFNGFWNSRRRFRRGAIGCVLRKGGRGDAGGKGA